MLTSKLKKLRFICHLLIMHQHKCFHHEH